MPCSDAGQLSYEYNKRSEEIRTLTAMLCEAVALLKANHLTLPPSVAAWSILHDAEDANRLELQRLIQEATQELDGLRAEEDQ